MKLYSWLHGRDSTYHDEESRILSNLSIYIDILYMPKHGKHHISLGSLKNAPANRWEERVPYWVCQSECLLDCSFLVC